MSEFSTDFSKKLIDAASFVVKDGMDSLDAERTVNYLSKLSCEITLKALLEKAGVPVPEIKKLSHKLGRLLDRFGDCEVKAEVVNGRLDWVPATRLRAEPIKTSMGEATIGTLLTCEEQGASKYPNEIRYGDDIKDFPPEAHLQAAIVLLDWARIHWKIIR